MKFPTIHYVHDLLKSLPQWDQCRVGKKSILCVDSVCVDRVCVDRVCVCWCVCGQGVCWCLLTHLLLMCRPVPAEVLPEGEEVQLPPCVH